MSLLCVNHKEKTIEWSGANNPIWILTANNSNKTDKKADLIEEIKPDKMPIAIYEKMDKFTTHKIDLEECKARLCLP